MPLLFWPDIDTVSTELKSFADADILFYGEPLHDSRSEWVFWWGAAGPGKHSKRFGY